MTREITAKEIEQIRASISYNPETGLFTRVSNFPKGTAPGTTSVPAGYVDDCYLKIKVCNRSYRAHRIAFVLMNEKQPEIVDHINGNKLDNRWCNLRAANRSINVINRYQKAGVDKDLPIGVFRVYGGENRPARYRVIVQGGGEKFDCYFDDMSEAIKNAETQRAVFLAKALREFAFA